MKTRGSYLAFAALLSVLPVAAQDAPSPWYDRIELRGDLRLRYETIDEDGGEARERERLRLRLTAEAEVSDTVSATVGVATGDGNPVSDNITLGDGFQKADIRLKLACIAWTPRDGLQARAGKMNQPWIAVQDLVWDSDLTPEGGAVLYRRQADAVDVLASGGAFGIRERADDDDTRLYHGQGALDVKLPNKQKWRIGGSYFHYDNMKGYSLPSYEPEDGFGNTVIDEGTADDPRLVYAEDFELVEGFTELTLNLYYPLRLQGQYVINDAADRDNCGYLAGLVLGRAQAVNSIELLYNYRRLEKNAVVGAFTDSSSGGGGTDLEGHKIAVKYQLSKNLQAGFACYLNTKNLDDGHDYSRLQLDLQVKF